MAVLRQLVGLCVLASLLCASIHAQQRNDLFISRIFERYGNGGVIGFEGLEHLLENLGLGFIKFQKSHNVSSHRTSNGTFAELHHSLSLHEHNHTRSKRAIKADERCLSPEDLLQLHGYYPGHGVVISEPGFLGLCPALVHQLDRRLCSPRAIFNQNPDLGGKAWFYAISSVALMSCVGLFGVILVPILDKALFSRVLSLLGALAVGTLSGDALLHLLPHALQAHPGGGVVITRAGVTFLTVLLFFTLEAAFHVRRNKARLNTQEKTKDNKEEEATIYAMVPVTTDNSHDHDHESNVIWMVITGDGLHNLTDGLAMGAAFRQDLMTGIATALAVLTHELPHELGDFALLLQNGLSLKKALFYNLISSVLSFAGVVLGLLLADYSEAALWVYSATAGSFLYIALATLMPEMQRQSSGVVTLMIQVAGILTGGALMFLIAIYEHSFHEFLKDLD